MNTDTIKLLLVDLQLFAYSGYGNKKANPQDDDRNTYIDDRGVERYVGSNNRVGGNVNDNTGKYATKTVEAPKKSSKTTTAYTKDGKIYTFEGDNWVNYAKDNGITAGLSRAITYPSYVTANEANRFLNENAAAYGVNVPGGDAGKGVFDVLPSGGLQQSINTGSIGLNYGQGNALAGNGLYNNAEYNFDYGRPSDYSSKYSAQIDALLNEILNRDAFSYNAGDDPLFQQFKNQYLREGQRAMNDTLASAAAGAGGMNSYAISAANQAQNYYNSQLGDKIPELYQLAYDMYLSDIDNQVRNLGLLEQMDETQYGRFRDTLNDWYNDRDFAYNQYRDDVNDSRWQKEFDYNAGRDAVNDSRYENEWSYNTGLDSYESAYNQAMQFLAAGIMPSSELLAKAGISLSEAQAYINKVNGKSSKASGGSGGSGSTGGGSTGSNGYTGSGNGYTGSGYEPNNNAVNGDEYGRIPARVSEAELRSVVEKYPDRFEITEVYDDETGKTTYKYKYKG